MTKYGSSCVVTDFQRAYTLESIRVDCARKYVANLSHTLDILDPIYA